MSEHVIAATDGAAQPNPGPAGWAWVLADADGVPARGESGFLGKSTNNVGELTAIQKLLIGTDPSVPMEIRVDSQYAMNAVTVWLPKQRRRGYTTMAGKPIKNRELIVHIDQLLTGREVTFTWVKAHQSNGDALNAAADRAAQQAVREGQGHSMTFHDLGEATPAPAQQRTVPRAASGGRCAARTKAGKPCTIEPRPSGLCHVHDPEVQCQAITSQGRRCAVATGGGRCAQHRDKLV